MKKNNALNGALSALIIGSLAGLSIDSPLRLFFDIVLIIAVIIVIIKIVYKEKMKKSRKQNKKKK